MFGNIEIAQISHKITGKSDIIVDVSYVNQCVCIHVDIRKRRAEEKRKRRHVRTS